MIAESLDHFVILCPDLQASVRSYETLLGRTCDWQQSMPDDGTASALFQLSNTSVELIAPVGTGPVGTRIRDILGDRKGALTSLAFRTSDIGEAHYTAMRRGLKPADIITQSADYLGLTRQWTRFRCEDTSFGDVKLFFIKQDRGELPVMGAQSGAASRVDHIVVNTGNPDRTMAGFGAKLGLRLALDRTNEKWGSRFLFFTTQDLTIEVIQRLDGSFPEGQPDKLWGVTYEMDDLDQARSRLMLAGVSVSEVRKGRKPGTRVMSVKSHDLGVPTLLLDKRGE
jgi:catechol 2,3-dioxygenase-like lactoylglutathione lyase family enzyme